MHRGGARGKAREADRRKPRRAGGARGGVARGGSPAPSSPRSRVQSRSDFGRGSHEHGGGCRMLARSRRTRGAYRSNSRNPTMQLRVGFEMTYACPQPTRRLRRRPVDHLRPEHARELQGMDGRGATRLSADESWRQGRRTIRGQGRLRFAAECEVDDRQLLRGAPLRGAEAATRRGPVLGRLREFAAAPVSCPSRPEARPATGCFPRLRETYAPGPRAVACDRRLPGCSRSSRPAVPRKYTGR